MSWCVVHVAWVNAAAQVCVVRFSIGHSRPCMGIPSTPSTAPSTRLQRSRGRQNPRITWMINGGVLMKRTQSSWMLIRHLL